MEDSLHLNRGRLHFSFLSRRVPASLIFFSVKYQFFDDLTNLSFVKNTGNTSGYFSSRISIHLRQISFFKNFVCSQHGRYSFNSETISPLFSTFFRVLLLFVVFFSSYCFLCFRTAMFMSFFFFFGGRGCFL